MIILTGIILENGAERTDHQMQPLYSSFFFQSRPFCFDIDAKSYREERNKHINAQYPSNKQTNKQTNKQASKQTNKQTNQPTNQPTNETELKLLFIQQLTCSTCLLQLHTHTYTHIHTHKTHLIIMYFVCSIGISEQQTVVFFKHQYYYVILLFSSLITVAIETEHRKFFSSEHSRYWNVLSSICFYGITYCISGYFLSFSFCFVFRNSFVSFWFFFISSGFVSVNIILIVVV